MQQKREYIVLEWLHVQLIQVEIGVWQVEWTNNLGDRERTPRLTSYKAAKIAYQDRIDIEMEDED